MALSRHSKTGCCHIGEEVLISCLLQKSLHCRYIYLAYQILIALAIGAVIGHFFPDFGMALEEATGLSIDDGDMAGLKTVGDVLNYLQDHQN